MVAFGNRLLVVFALLYVPVACATASPDSIGGGTSELQAEVETMRIEGVPTVYGNEPRTYVAITVYGPGKTEELSYYVRPDMQQELRSMTGTRYVFTGHLYDGEERFFDARLHDGVFVPESWEVAE